MNVKQLEYYLELYRNILINREKLLASVTDREKKTEIISRIEEVKLIIKFITDLLELKKSKGCMLCDYYDTLHNTCLYFKDGNCKSKDCEHFEEIK